MAGIASVRVSAVFRADGVRPESRLDYWCVHADRPPRSHLGRCFRAELRLEQDGRQATRRPGDLSFDPARPSERSFTAMHNVTLSIPTAMLPLHDRELAEPTGARIPGAHGAGAPASVLTRQLAGRVDRIGAVEAAAGHRGR